MEDRWRYVGGISATAGLFALIHLGGLYLVSPIVTTAPTPTGTPDDPRIGLLFVVALVVVTGLMLAAFRWGFDWVVRAVVLLVSFGLTVIVLDVLVPSVLVGGIPVIPFFLGLGLVALLATHPDWYVLNVAGVLMGAGATGLLGVTLGIRAALALLVLLAVYDLISVYGTKHMLTLADGAMRGGLPVVLVVPLTLPYTLLDSEDDGFHPDGALVIGLGDAVIPGLLATSAALYGPVEPTIIAGLAVSGPVIGVIVGTLLGLVALFVIPAQGEPHPGLPFLASGAIAGYLLGAAAVGIGPIEAVAAIALVSGL